MLIVKDVIKDSIFGTIQNGSFVPIIETDNIKTFEENNGTTQEETTYRINCTDDFSIVYECKFSRKSHKALELMRLFGWRNKMPFRKRLLKKAVHERVKYDYRRGYYVD